MSDRVKFLSKNSASSYPIMTDFAHYGHSGQNGHGWQVENGFNLDAIYNMSSLMIL